MLQLDHLSVRRLLGRFDHEIAFPGEWEFVILHGPNGVGKTRLLELVDAVGNKRLLALLEMPFESAEFRFSDKSILRFERLGWQQLPGVEREVPPPFEL